MSEPRAAAGGAGATAYVLQPGEGRRLDEIALRYGMEVTGPVPEGYL
jgi:hypothetical protein